MSAESHSSSVPESRHGPLGPLALSLSGGGYRAAAFHLGTMRLLDRVGLLRDVVGLSTVSGGTLTGLAWVVSQLDGKSFPEFYDGLSNYLKQTNVIGEALEVLTSRREHESHAWASLIRSAAEVYARPNLFGDRRFGEVLGARQLQLREAIFNTTEFHTGQDFRFWYSANPEVREGNHNDPVPRSVVEHVRLADILAASSCFPGGFEPLVFPQDFHWSRSFTLQDARKQLGPKFEGGLPLMDGGIYDNQGIDSMLLAFKDSASIQLLISDVSTQETDMYNVPANPTKRGWVTLRAVSWMAWGLLALAVATAVTLGWRGFEAVKADGWRWQDYFLYLVPGALSAAVAGALVWGRRRLRDVNALIREQVDVNAWPVLRKLTVAELTQMLALRASSLLALTSKVFMKRVRGLIFERVYQDPTYQGRRMANLIFALLKPYTPLFSKHPWMQPGAQLTKQIEAACAMPTTLWFTDETQFSTVETAGEATVCFVLLRHLLEAHPGEYEKAGTPLHDLFQKLRREWEGFNQDARPAETPEKVAA